MEELAIGDTRADVETFVDMRGTDDNKGQVLWVIQRRRGAAEGDAKRKKVGDR